AGARLHASFRGPRSVADDRLRVRHRASRPRRHVRSAGRRGRGSAHPLRPHSLRSRSGGELMTNTIDYGIDLGTTNSAIARQEGIRSVLLPDETGEVLLPSVLHIRADGTRITGRAARALADSDPKNTAIEFKRMMGTDQR